MALVSPGVEVTVINESSFVPSLAGSVPLVIVATAEDKAAGTGTGLAPLTSKANANKPWLIDSQRDLVANFGNPLFFQATNGTPLHGYELNEYGIMAAYSLLGVSNRCYVMRADIDLDQLASSTNRPRGNPPANTYWLNTKTTSSGTDWGLFVWNQSTGKFTTITPIVISLTTDLDGGTPKTSIGAVGSYAVVATNTNNPVYFKNTSNAWVLIGSASWQQAWPAVQGTATNPTLTSGNSILINTNTVTLTGTTVSILASDINTASITGITAAAVNGKLEIYVTSLSESNGSVTDGIAAIANDTGTILVDVEITADSYASPALAQTTHTSVPAWKSTDVVSRPTGSVWSKLSVSGGGADFSISIWTAASSSFVRVLAPLYANDRSANADLDTAGGKGIAEGSLYVQFDVTENNTATFKLFRRFLSGELSVTGILADPTLTASDEFTISASSPNSTTLSAPVTVITSGTTNTDLASDINAANVTSVKAQVEISGAISIIHEQGGVIVLDETVGNPIQDTGISTTLSTGQVKLGNSGEFVLSNWVALVYTAADGAPSADPVNLQSWYDTNLEADIMIHDGTNWLGYKNETLDARGFDLSATSPDGPTISASEPLVQSDNSNLVLGDLWIDSSDLENYPRLYRYENVNGENKFVLIDNTDQTGEDGILFADARFHGDTTTDVVTGPITTIASLQTNNTLDLDAPDPKLFPRGMLLFNTRRSGLVVKEFRDNYFSRVNFSDVGLFPTLPFEKDAWVTISGNDTNGAAFMGRKAQRNTIVKALKSAIDSNDDIREEQRDFNLIATPGYVELISDMVELNNDRRNTAFIVGDTPFRLAGNSSAILNWATNAALVTDNGDDGIVTQDTYMGLFYPSGLSNDLDGNQIAVPPSHMMLRTIIQSDNKSFQWFAPAGVRRGIIDNATSLGYINAITGEFITTAVAESVRDTLYDNNINPLTFLPQAGLVNYGNKTHIGTPSALDRINVARLIAFLRKQLKQTALPFVFEPNDQITRNELKQLIEQALNDLIAKRAIFDYLVVSDETNNTPDRIDRSELYVDVAIEPVKAAEFIFIPIRLKNTGEISSGNIAPSLAV